MWKHEKSRNPALQRRGRIWLSFSQLKVGLSLFLLVSIQEPRACKPPLIRGSPTEAAWIGTLTFIMILSAIIIAGFDLLLKSFAQRCSRAC